MIAEQTIERVKQLMNVVDVVGAFVTLKKKGADLVGLCPFHSEKTPSFTVSPSKQIYKCFGCGKSGDAIEFLKEHEKFTYVETIEWLIKRYNVERVEVESKKIVKPVPRLQKVSDQILQFFEVGRKISNNTLLRFNITQADEWMPKADAVVPAICFNYYRNEELVNIKFRANNKDFKLSKDAELIFYNLDAIKDEEECVIVEGEIDCLSCYEDKIYNCISVPNGANVKGELRLEYLDNCVDYFKNKTRIVIMTDNDEAGIRLRDELARRLGFQRCVRVIYPDGCKDANEVWKKYGEGSLQKMVDNAIEWPMEGILSMMDMMDEVISFYENGYPKGFEILSPVLKRRCS
jgi:DNA primase